MASGRPAFGSRFNTGNMESALLARGFHYGTAANSVVIGWNGGHAAVTLPDGTPVSSGESGSGVRIGGGGAYQPQFTRHMYLPVEAQEMNTEPAPSAEPAAPVPTELPPPAEAPAPTGALAPTEAPAPTDASHAPGVEPVTPPPSPEPAVQQASVIDLAVQGGHGPLPGPPPAL